MPWHVADIAASITFGVISLGGIIYSLTQDIVDKVGIYVAGVFFVLLGLILVWSIFNIGHNFRCLYKDIMGIT
jgi:hypothetical protein